ncbi:MULTISPECIES: N-6 DNA methylase [unclassified Paraburkholderia]|uniref:N-6 DNA methylase n=1 Tax=unclassified Paraburkholderia TaxID=2615204 RepID=UPI002AB3165A|nr:MULTISPECIES: N-6 DNA methylase [unclassified Paraburkholderia]
MSRKSAERKFDQTADEHQRNFVSLIKQFSYGHHLDSVFRDFVELAALAISNSVDRGQFDAREKRYLEIVGKYKKEEVARFPLMLAEITLAFDKRVGVMAAARERGVMASNLTDVLGQTYMMLDLGNDRSGQFFTPYHVSKLMAGMIGGDAVARADAQGFARVHEPACGAGGMVIATAEAFHDAGLNYQQTMHATCIDIDPCCVHMTYLQLALLHIPAIVVHGNALTMEVWGHWFTPAHVLGGWNRKLRARRSHDAMRSIMRAVPAADDDGELAQELANGPVAVEPEDGMPVIEEAEARVEVVTDEALEVAVLDRPVVEVDAAVSDDAGALADLFDEIVSTPARPVDVFEVIDQLTLF